LHDDDNDVDEVYDSREEFDDGEDSERAYNGLGEDHSSWRESYSYGRTTDS
jgi:hypothetical protein